MLWTGRCKYTDSLPDMAVHHALVPCGPEVFRQTRTQREGENSTELSAVRLRSRWPPPHVLEHRVLG